MAWRSHVSADDQRVIDQQPGTALFRQVASGALFSLALHGLKSRVAKEHHPRMTLTWMHTASPSDPLHGYRVLLTEKVGDMMEELDNRTGGHGQKTAAWLDAKAHELQHYVQNHLR